MTESFSGCEAAFSSTEAAGVEALAEPAAAEGITYIVATGDAGAAGCDYASESTAQGPVSVNALASTPFTIALGGTQFNENVSVDRSHHAEAQSSRAFQMSS